QQDNGSTRFDCRQKAVDVAAKRWRFGRDQRDRGAGSSAARDPPWKHRCDETEGSVPSPNPWQYPGRKDKALAMFFTRSSADGRTLADVDAEASGGDVPTRNLSNGRAGDGRVAGKRQRPERGRRRQAFGRVGGAG